MKITKDIFESVNALYNEIGMNVRSDNAVDETLERLYAEFNSFVDKYDFTNEVFTDASGLKGVNWCWGGVMVPAQYETIKCMTPFAVPADYNFVVASRGGKDYLVNYLGEEVFQADEIRPNVGAIPPVVFRDGDKWGMAGSTGKVILPARYDSIQPDANDFIFLSLGGKEGFIAGGHIIEPKFDSIEIDDKEYIIVTLNGETGYIDENDEFTTDIKEAYYNYQMFV